MKLPSAVFIAAFAGIAISMHAPQSPKKHLHLRHPGILPDNNHAVTDGLGEQKEGAPTAFTIPHEIPNLLADSCPKKDLGFCGKEDSCCPMKGTCCPMGAGCCTEAQSGCFRDEDGKTRCCNVNTQKLCASKTCIPKNTVCCRDGGYCAAGSYCTKGGCCPAGSICKQKTGGKAGAADPRGVAPGRLREI